MTWETKIMVTRTLERMRQELKTIFLEGQVLTTRDILLGREFYDDRAC